MPEATQKLPDNDPRVIAWEEYKKSPEYENSKRWAEDPKFIEGSLWAAFIKGWDLLSQPAQEPVDKILDRITDEYARQTTDLLDRQVLLEALGRSGIFAAPPDTGTREAMAMAALEKERGTVTYFPLGKPGEKWSYYDRNADLVARGNTATDAILADGRER